MIYEFYTGSYAGKEEEGICRYRLDPETETLTKLWGFQGIENPSYVISRRDGSVLYAAGEESPEGKVFALSASGKGLQIQTSLSSGGADPCHLSLDFTETELYVSNYTGGSLCVYSLDQEGGLEKAGDRIRHTGRGADPKRQEHSHLHFAREYGRYVYAVDFGADEIYLYRQGEKAGTLTDTGMRLAVAAGTGPRHLERFGDDVLYVIGELKNTITVFRRAGGGWERSGVLDTLPPEGCEGSWASAIRRSGSFLFAANRGHDSIALFELDKTGEPHLLQILPCGGKTPREIEILGDFLVVANQDSDSLSVLRLNRRTKRLEPTGMGAKCVRPSCICPCRDL